MRLPLLLLLLLLLDPVAEAAVIMEMRTTGEILLVPRMGEGRREPPPLLPLVAVQHPWPICSPRQRTSSTLVPEAFRAPGRQPGTPVAGFL